MPKSSSQNRHRVSQAELEKLFTDHAFEKKLPTCKTHIVCDEEYSSAHNPLKKPYAKKRGLRYIDAQTGEEVAVVFYYTRHDQTSFQTISRLHIEGNIYEALLV